MCVCVYVCSKLPCCSIMDAAGFQWAVTAGSSTKCVGCRLQDGGRTRRLCVLMSGSAGGRVPTPAAARQRRNPCTSPSRPGFPRRCRHSCWRFAFPACFVASSHEWPRPDAKLTRLMFFSKIMNPRRGERSPRPRGHSCTTAVFVLPQERITSSLWSQLSANTRLKFLDLS